VGHKRLIPIPAKIAQILDRLIFSMLKRTRMLKGHTKDSRSARKWPVKNEEKIAARR